MLYAFKLGRKLRGEEPYCPEKGGKGGSSDKSAKYAAEAQKYAADLQNQQWQTIMKNLAPFTPLAEQYVNQLQNLSSLEGQGQALNQYYNSQQYKDLAGQARYQSLAAAEATGGLGSTATSNQLATIAPTLGQSWLSNQMSNYNNLANVGLGALQGQANAGQTYANNMSSIAQQSAALAAANANKPSSLQTAISGGTSGAISKLQSYRDELVRNAGPDGPVNLDLKQLSDLRSQFRMDVKGERPVLPNRSDAAIQRVYKAMTDDINGAIGQNLGNDTLRKYQQANAVYADEAAKLKNTRLKNVLMKGDLTPEVVNNMLFSKNKSEIKTLYNSVGRVGRAQMRNGIIGKAMEKSGGSPDQFLRQLNILQNQTGITFKGQDAAYLKGLKNYLQSTQQAAKAAVTTPTGQQTIPFIIGYGTAMNPATTGAAVSYGLLTRAYESEPFRNAMLRMANTPRGSTAFEKAMQQAQKVINALTQGAKSDALSW